MSECPHCGLKFAEEQSSCPNCGQRISLAHAETPGPWSLFSGYFRTLWTILTQPASFFRKMPVKGGLTRPLAFALVTHWLGSALAFLWRMLIGASMGDIFERFFKVAGDIAEVDSPGGSFRWNQVMDLRSHMMDWFWGPGAVVLDPFFTLFSILFTSFLVFLGSRILVSPGRDGHPREIDYEMAARIVCYGMAPTILGGIPIFGSGLATLLGAIITIIGAKEVYRIGVGRAIVVGLFPKVLLLATILAGFFIFAIAFAKMLISFF